MLHSSEELFGRRLHATDGEIGEIRNFYFDDQAWALRYFVVETSPWFNSRQVLIAPECFLNIDWRSNSIPVNLTRDQVKNSPGIDTQETVTRQQEESIIRHYGWTSYWTVRALDRQPEAAIEGGLHTAVAEEPSHLRDDREVVGYAVRSKTEETGRLERFILDDTCWQIRYLTVDLGLRIPGKRVLVPPELIDRVDWNNTRIDVRLSTDQLLQAPAYIPGTPVTRDDEDRLCGYYYRDK
jgi:hypothetical protein